jgi:hypothetical protein
MLLYANSAFCANTPRTAFQIRCEDTIPKTVSVVAARQQGYSIDQSVSYRRLTQMGAMPNGVVLGLTQMKSRIEMHVSGPILQDPSTGYECIAPQVQVEIVYAPMVVYVAREFPQGTCAYRQILEHEMRHVQVYREHLPKAEAAVKIALRAAFQAEPLYAPSGSANILLQQKMSDGWMAFIQGELNKVEERQALIDTAQEYARLGKVCGGEVPKILLGR